MRAISDLHVTYAENRRLVEELRPACPDDWLIVAGDIAEATADVEWALRTLAGRFAQVIWTPGNHELWTVDRDEVTLRGVERYEHLLAICRGLGVLTPEDPYPLWTGAGGPVRVAPLFVLYDYTFLAPGTATVAASKQAAHDAGIVCADERFLYPDPYPSREAWCAARLEYTERRLRDIAGDVPLVLVSHWPLVREPTAIMTYQEFAQWCGTVHTGDWHTRFGAVLSVYGHLHIPRRTVYDGVPFEEVSIGYPREWNRFGLRGDLAREVLVDPGDRSA